MASGLEDGNTELEFEETLSRIRVEALKSEIAALTGLEREGGLDLDGRKRLAELLARKSGRGRDN